jgi:hypothetical protein
MKESAKEANQMYSLKLIKMKKPIRGDEANQNENSHYFFFPEMRDRELTAWLISSG